MLWLRRRYDELQPGMAAKVCEQYASFVTQMNAKANTDTPEMTLDLVKIDFEKMSVLGPSVR